jgi:hypothetical protein
MDLGSASGLAGGIGGALPGPGCVDALDVSTFEFALLPARSQPRISEAVATAIANVTHHRICFANRIAAHSAERSTLSRSVPMYAVSLQGSSDRLREPGRKLQL